METKKFNKNELDEQIKRTDDLLKKAGDIIKNIRQTIASNVGDNDKTNDEKTF